MTKKRVTKRYRIHADELGRTVWECSNKQDALLFTKEWRRKYGDMTVTLIKTGAVIYETNPWK